MESIAIDKQPAHNLELSPHQQELLIAALNSNKPGSNTASPKFATGNALMAPMALNESPLQAPASGTLGAFDDSPFVDYEYDFDADGTFDFDMPAGEQGQMIGSLPGTSTTSEGEKANGEKDIHDKRSHPDDGEEEEGGGKRREGEDKQTKKPGRKPLTSEPTSKRKAQNRAAQRAFRERKEKHLKDLETKVEDLQKASESANHENAVLRAQIEKMAIELREYKKRLSTNGAVRPSIGANPVPSYLAKGLGLGALPANNPNDVNFQFEFPKFGQLPGPPVFANGALRKEPSLTTTSNKPKGSIDRGSISPLDNSSKHGSISSVSGLPSIYNTSDMATFSGLFSPSTLESVNKDASFDYMSAASKTRSNTEISNGQSSNGHSTSYNSPTDSSNSNSGNGPSSSCGTSPEPSGPSPSGGKPLDTLNTIGEEHGANPVEAELSFCDKLNMACGNPKNPVPRALSQSGTASDLLGTNAFDMNGIDWLAEQNGGQFDPQLFGDYRESQDNILSGTFDDTFFSDAFAVPDFNSPFNAPAAPPAPAKKDLLQEIDDKQSEDEEVVPADDPSQLLTCNKIWDRLQDCPKVQSGEFDLDGLCSELQAKAKCSETGAVVDEKDFKKIMESYGGPACKV